MGRSFCDPVDVEMSRQLQSASALALGWGVLLASFAEGHLSAVPATAMKPALLLLGGALGAQALAQRRPSAGLAVLGALALGGLLGPLAVACVAVHLLLSSREGSAEGVSAAVARGLLATGFGLAVLFDACAGRSLLGQVASFSERELMLTDLHQVQWLLLCVPVLQMGLAAAIAGPQHDEDRASEDSERGERFPLCITAVSALITLGAAYAVAWDAPWRMHWGGHIHVAEHATIGLAVFAALRLLVVVAEHPRAPRLSGVQASTVAASGVLAMLIADSLTLALPMLVGALVVGRSPRRRLLGAHRRGRRDASPGRHTGATRGAHRPGSSRRSRSAS